jgi:signal transduction histidine kinase
VTVSARRVEGSATDVEVVVEDAGPGLPWEEVDRLFEPFARGERARRRAVPGSGLGLAVVRRVAEAHGGTVRAEPRPGGGARFVLRWPGWTESLEPEPRRPGGEPRGDRDEDRGEDRDVDGDGGARR